MNGLDIEIKENIGMVRMNFNEENTLTPENIYYLIESLEELADNKDAHVILLSGSSPKYFSTGLSPDALGKEGGPEACFKAVMALISRVYPLKKILIACVDGYAIAGGAVLSILADYRIISKRARFAFNEILLGLTMNQMLVDIIKEEVGHHAKLICQTGYIIKPDKALEIGMADFIYDEQEINTRAFVFARKLARLNNPALCHVKKVFRREVIERSKEFISEDNQAFKESFESEYFVSSIDRLLKSSQKKSN